MRAAFVAQQLFLLTACIHLLMPALIRTCFSICLASNFTLGITLTSAGFHHLSLLDVLVLLTILLIVCLAHPANLHSIQLSLITLWHGSLNRFTPIWFLCMIRTARFPPPTSGQPRQLASSPLWMELLALSSHPILVGWRLTPTTLLAVWSKIWL